MTLDEIPTDNYWTILDEEPVRTSSMAIILRDGKFLMGLRGEGCEVAKNIFGFPGGKVKFGQDPIDSTIREVWEETGLIIRKKYMIFLDYANEFFPKEGRHYVSLRFLVWHSEGQPRVKEKDKCKYWKWIDPLRIPTNTVKANRKTLKEHMESIRSCIAMERAKNYRIYDYQ